MRLIFIYFVGGKAGRGNKLLGLLSSSNGKKEREGLSK